MIISLLIFCCVGPLTSLKFLCNSDLFRIQHTQNFITKLITLVEIKDNWFDFNGEYSTLDTFISRIELIILHTRYVLTQDGLYIPQITENTKPENLNFKFLNYQLSQIFSNDIDFSLNAFSYSSTPQTRFDYLPFPNKLILQQNTNPFFQDYLYKEKFYDITFESLLKLRSEYNEEIDFVTANLTLSLSLSNFGHINIDLNSSLLPSIADQSFSFCSELVSYGNLYRNTSIHDLIECYLPLIPKNESLTLKEIQKNEINSQSVTLYTICNNKKLCLYDEEKETYRDDETIDRSRNSDFILGICCLLVFTSIFVTSMLTVVCRYT